MAPLADVLLSLVIRLPFSLNIRYVNRDVDREQFHLRTGVDQPNEGKLSIEVVQYNIFRAMLVFQCRWRTGIVRPINVCFDFGLRSGWEIVHEMS